MARFRAGSPYRILLSYLQASLRARLTDRWDLAVGTLSIALHHALGIAFLTLVFRHLPHLDGWTYPEVLLVFGAFQIVSSLFYFFFSWTLWFSSLYLVERRLDFLLIRPAPTLLLVIAEGSGQSLPEFPGALFGVAICSTALRLMHYPLSFGTLTVYALLLLVGAAVLGGLFTLMALSGFWFRARRSPAEPLMSAIEFAQYPQQIYVHWLRLVFTFVFPLAFVSFWPTSWLLGRSSALVPLGSIVWASVLWVAVVFVWRRGIARYESAGS